MEQDTLKFLNKIYILAIILVIGLILFLFSVMGYNAKLADQQNQNQITVSGEGKVYAKPDIAIINLGVNTTGVTVAGVTKINTDKMNAVIDAVKKLGVEDKDIQTTNYNLSPTYNYTEFAGRIFEGYTLDQNIEVKIRDFTKIGDIVSGATSNGANLAGNLQFTIDDPEQFKNEARAKAIAKATANAQNLAKTSGISLGKLINVFESTSNYPMMYSNKAMGMGGAVLESAPSPSIQPGQQEINITISLTYKIN